MVLGALSVAAVLAAGTVRIERVGRAPASWARELCAPEPLHPCTQGVLQGGWPVPFLFDRPGISVMGKLAFVEDLFSRRDFLVDVLSLWLPLGAAAYAIALRRGRKPS